MDKKQLWQAKAKVKIKKKSKEEKLWAGRFREAMAKSAEAFSSSVHYDVRLYKQDIIQSMAYARALFQAHILTGVECKKIVRALEEILKGSGAGKLNSDRNWKTCT